ncbi:MAG: MFS transporter [Acidobacteriota bacterium]
MLRHFPRERIPARHALLPSLVPRADLPNAISLNTMATQTASVAGPACGGLLIATAGVGWVYAANAVSFLFVIGALFYFFKNSSQAAQADMTRVLGDCRLARNGLRPTTERPRPRSFLEFKCLLTPLIRTLCGSSSKLVSTRSIRDGSQ